MMEITVKWDEVTISIKRENAESIDDCIELVNEALAYHGYDIGEALPLEEDDNIYIECDQPKDHVQHEGM